MKRYALDKPLVQRRLRNWKSLSISAAGDSMAAGRFRKRKPLDCGRARCGLCHSEKIHDRPSASQRRANERAVYEVNEALQG